MYDATDARRSPMCRPFGALAARAIVVNQYGEILGYLDQRKVILP